MRKYKAKQRAIQQNLKPNQQYDSASLKHSENHQAIQQYDLETNHQIVQENLQPHQQNGSATLKNEESRSIRVTLIELRSAHIQL